MEKFPCQIYVNGAKRGRHWLPHRPVVAEVLTFDKQDMTVKSCIFSIDTGDYVVELEYQLENSGFQRSGWNDAETAKEDKPGKHPGGKRH